ncbi:hypothetical protein JCM1841_005343 [Sporobolomyces salmonicolor]
MKVSTILAFALPFLSSLAAAHDCDASTHRRHHSKQVAKHRHSAALASTSTGPAHHHSAHKATSTAVQTAAASTTGSAPASSPSVTQAAVQLDATSSGGIGWGLNGVQKNGIGLGFLPDDGSGGGTPETIFEIQNKLGQSASAQGWYAQAVSGTLFDGSQFAARKDQIIAGGVFQPAVMPTGGWWGLTSSDNQQAVAICNVMKEYTDAGVQVWLRFAHEGADAFLERYSTRRGRRLIFCLFRPSTVNYYQSVGTYQGTAADFKEGWATVHAACKQIAPEVKFFFTPNVASLDVYQQYYPDDPSTVDFIGIDYYPQQPGQDTFVSTMKPFHDAYTTPNGPMFAIGETGLGVDAPIASRLAWLEQIMSADTKAQMPNLIAVSWFNWKDNYSYKVIDDVGDSITTEFLTGAA